MTRWFVLWAVCLLLVGGDAAAQRLTSGHSVGSPAGDLIPVGSAFVNISNTPEWILPVSSALIPGSGQLLSGHERGVLYLAAEAFLMLRFWSLRSEGRRQRDDFQDLAFSVARAPFRPASRDTVFEYFEAMESYLESGPFSTSSGVELVPPTDESTFNGRIWLLARETFLPDPDSPPDTSSDEYQRALDFYRARAIGANFQWSWRDAGLERDLFSQSISRSDDAFRMGTQYLGLVLVNHLVSAIDAFVTQRLASQASLNTAIVAGPDRGQDVVARVMFRVEF
jgi:hypothetical protein